MKTGEKDQTGIDGAILIRGSDFQSTVNIISVENLDEGIKRVDAAGGKQKSEKSDITGVGRFCYCMETKRNRFRMFQPITD